MKKTIWLQKPDYFFVFAILRLGCFLENKKERTYFAIAFRLSKIAFFALV